MNCDTKQSIFKELWGRLCLQGPKPTWLLVPIQLPAYVAGKASEHRPRSGPCSHVGDAAAAPGPSLAQPPLLRSFGT